MGSIIHKLVFLFTPLPYFFFLLFFSVNANAALLDWDVETWVPAGRSNLSETYVIDGTATGGPRNVTVTWTGNTAWLGDGGAIDDCPSINQTNTSGLSPVQNGLFLRSTYPDASNPEYTITLDFSDYPVGVSGISFTFSDVDIDASIIYSAQAIIANC